MERRLAAILVADVVGYSKLMGADQDATLDALRQLRSTLFDPIVTEHRGSVVKRMGDGWVVEFTSISDAVACALAIQSGLVDHEIIKLRVGIHTGDVVFEEEDVFGEGVNVAARLEALADPGQVLISDTAHSSLDGKAGEQFQGGESQELKNIARPVGIWRWPASESYNATPISLDTEPTLTLPNKPSIAVLAFDNMSGDPEQEYFADGIAEDVITALSRNRYLFVIARNSSFSYRGKSTDIRTIGQELGVRFVLEGSVRRAGNRVRITAQLIEAETGNHVWAERYDRPVTDIFDVQDEITSNVAGAVGSEITFADIKAVAGKRIEDLQSWERFVKANWHLLKLNPEDNRKGLEICKAEITATGGSTEFYALLSLGYSFELIGAIGERPPAEVIKDGMQAAHTAIGLDANNEIAHAFLSLLLWLCGEHESALSEAMVAIELNPNYALGHQMAGCALGYSGPEHYDAAMERMNFAIRLGPRDLNLRICYTQMAQISFISEKYGESIEFAKTAIRHDPTYGYAHRVLAAALASEGQIEAAKEAWNRALELQPFDQSSYLALVRRFHKREEDAENYIDALKLTGGLSE